MITWRTKPFQLIKGFFTQKHTKTTEIIEFEPLTFGLISAIDTSGQGIISAIKTNGKGIESTITTDGKGIISSLTRAGQGVESGI